MGGRNIRKTLSLTVCALLCKLYGPHDPVSPSSLGGYAPFYEHPSRPSVQEQIIQGEFTMVPSKWKGISDQGILSNTTYHLYSP